MKIRTRPFARRNSARDAGVPVTSDIDRMTNRTGELVAAVTIPMFNEHVLPEFTGESDIDAGADASCASRTPACSASRSARAAR